MLWPHFVPAKGMIASSDQHAIERQKIFGDDRWSKKRK
jgi:hypothetical protein